MKDTTWTLVLAALLALPSAVTAQTLTDADAIAERASNAAYYQGDDGRATVRLTIQDPNGAERTRELTILRRDHEDGGDQDFLVVLSRPADLRDTVFLVAKHPGADDDRWMYLPDLDLVRRIAAGDKRTSFIGSHFFYEDVSGRSPADDTHTLVETTDEHYVLDNTPRETAGVEFASYRAWIDVTTFTPMRIEFTDASGEVYRRVEVLELETIDGHPTVTQSRVTDLRTGGHTTAEFRDVRYDVGLPANIFAERSLRNPPARFLR